MEKLKKFLKENKISLGKLSIMVNDVDNDLPVYPKASYSRWINGRRKWPYHVAAAVMTITAHRVLICDLMGKNNGQSKAN